MIKRYGISFGISIYYFVTKFNNIKIPEGRLINFQLGEGGGVQKSLASWIT
jgi:hypothetical protein